MVDEEVPGRPDDGQPRLVGLSATAGRVIPTALDIFLRIHYYIPVFDLTQLYRKWRTPWLPQLAPALRTIGVPSPPPGTRTPIMSTATPPRRPRLSSRRSRSEQVITCSNWPRGPASSARRGPS